MKDAAVQTRGNGRRAEQDNAAELRISADPRLPIAPNAPMAGRLQISGMAGDSQILLQAARAGDRAALGQLLEHYSSYLMVLARVQIGRRLQGKADPGDLVQETFLEANRQFPQFRGLTEAEFKAWIRRILAGQVALLLRRYLGTHRDMRLERELAVQIDQSSVMLEQGLVAAQSTPSQHVSRREQASLLADALAALKEDYREVIILRHLEGLGFGEVARRMGRTEDSVQKLWARALASLRRTMESQS